MVGISCGWVQCTSHFFYNGKFINEFPARLQQSVLGVHWRAGVHQRAEFGCDSQQVADRSYALRRQGSNLSYLTYWLDPQTMRAKTGDMCATELPSSLTAGLCVLSDGVPHLGSLSWAWLPCIFFTWELGHFCMHLGTSAHFQEIIKQGWLPSSSIKWAKTLARKTNEHSLDHEILCVWPKISAWRAKCTVLGRSVVCRTYSEVERPSKQPKTKQKWFRSYGNRRI